MHCLGPRPSTEPLLALTGVKRSLDPNTYTKARFARLAVTIAVPTMGLISGLVVGDRTKWQCLIEGADHPIRVGKNTTAVRHLLKGVTSITVDTEATCVAPAMVEEGEPWIMQEMTLDRLLKLAQVFPKLREVKVVGSSHEEDPDTWPEGERKIQTHVVADGEFFFEGTGEKLRDLN